MARNAKPVKPKSKSGKPLRTGEPSMKAPGSGEITAQLVGPDRRNERSAMVHADEDDALRMGKANPHKYED